MNPKITKLLAVLQILEFIVKEEFHAPLCIKHGYTVKIDLSFMSCGNIGKVASLSELQFPPLIQWG